jgi:hypothetical protein
MEAASENTKVKGRRGRPRRLSDTSMALYRSTWPDRTDRHRLNLHYATTAMVVLADDKRFAWLYDRKKMKAGERNSWRPGILAELGRIADPDDLRMVAAQVCTMRPKTKIAVALIRRWRLGKEEARGILSITVKLENAVNEHLQAHPSCSWEELETALEFVLEEVRERKRTPTR